MERVTKNRINAVQNAGTFISNLDSFAGLSQHELDEHHKLGELMIENASEVVKFLIELNKRS